MAFVAPETGMGVRRQLTLFLAGEMAAAVEAVRRVVDPEQYRLIPAHVTLCREEENASMTVRPDVGSKIRARRFLSPQS